MSDTFKAKLIYLTPILTSLLFGMLCTLLISSSSIELYRVTILPEDNIGPFLNAGYFVVLAGIGASLLYLLLKRKSHNLIKLVTGFALTTATFMLSFLYLYAAFSRFSFPYIEAVLLSFSSVITILVGFEIFRIQSRISNLIVICLGGGLGAFLGASIPTLSAILILCFLAVYDTFAVYHGPVGKIALSGLDRLHGLSFSFRDVQMGLGDLVFYSMLSGHILLNFSLTSWAASVTGIMVGCFLALKMLERKGIFPGLPIPILFGLVAGLFTSLL